MSDSLSLLQLGGWVMYVLVLCAWIALAVFLLRLWKTRVAVVSPEGVSERVLRSIRAGEAQSLHSVLTPDSAVARLTLLAIGEPTLDEASLRQDLEEAGRREITSLERYNSILSTIASVAPLLGLLGTILGLIAMFKSVGGDEMSAAKISADVMAGGIWKALLTTAAGLCVAIPALLGAKLLNARVDRRAELLEDYSSELVRRIVRQRGE